jgi:peptidoglycan/LPS O-acetylase OafA/YrhL
MYASKSPGLDLSHYRAFLEGRARRIVPAYLAAMVFAAGVWVVSRGDFPVREVLAHLVFAQTLVPGATRLSSPFWSLAAEWHFYMVLPLLLVLGQKLGERRALAGAFLLSIVFRAASTRFEASPIPLDMQLPSRLCEFVLGVAVARAYLGGVALPGILRGDKGAAIGLFVMLAGRVAMTDGIVRGRGLVSTLAMAVNVPVLALGYAILTWNVIATDSVAARALRTAPMQWLGRVSYSFYLWHWFPALWIGAAMTAHFGPRGFVPLAATLASTALVSPLAALSYRLFEAPYFAKRPAQGPSNEPMTPANRPPMTR